MWLVSIFFPLSPHLDHASECSVTSSTDERVPSNPQIVEVLAPAWVEFPIDLFQTEGVHEDEHGYVEANEPLPG